MFELVDMKKEVFIFELANLRKLSVLFFISEKCVCTKIVVVIGNGGGIIYRKVSM